MKVSDGAASPLRDALGAAAFDAGQLRSPLLRPALALPVPGAEDRGTWDPTAGNLDRAIRLSWPLDVPATLARRELDDPLPRDIWGETVTRIDLAAGQRTQLTVTAEADAPSDKDGR